MTYDNPYDCEDSDFDYLNDGISGLDYPEYAEDEGYEEFLDAWESYTDDDNNEEPF